MYTYDMPEEREGLYAAFVGSTEALAVIKGIDASEALAMEGVVAVLDAKDVPGDNKSDVEEVFASKQVCLADTCVLRAAALVCVDDTYSIHPLLGQKPVREHVSMQDPRQHLGARGG